MIHPLQAAEISEEPIEPAASSRDYLLAAGLLVLLVLGSYLLKPVIGAAPVALLFLTVMQGTAYALGFVPALMVALISALTLSAEPLTSLIYLVSALLSVWLIGRLRAREQRLRQREQRLGILYSFSRRLVEADSRESLLAMADAEISQDLHAQVYLLPLNELEALAEPDQAKIREALDQRAPIADSKAYYVPLVTPASTYGIIGLFGEQALDPGQRLLLETLCRQLALALEREALHEAATEAQLNRVSETLYDALLNSVSHELRTPLTTIQGSLENLRQPEILERGELRQALLADLDDARRRLSHLIANLLDMSRLQSGRLTLNRDWCEPGDIVRAALGTLRQELSAYPLEVSIPPDLPLLCVDFGLLEQALINLIHNALTHNPPGTPISVTICADQHWLEFSVADLGTGLEPECLPHLFDKFYRAPGTRSSGTGLGLSITRGFIEVHEGELTAELPGQGLRFRIRLPVPEQLSLPSEEEDAPVYSGH